jgi:hypothetical protein
MFQAIATLFAFGARQTMPAIAYPVLPMRVRVRETDSRRPRQSSLRCTWQADPITGRLEAHWTALQPSEALAIEPDPGWIALSFSERRWYAA